jgi:hypothetical protein
MEDRASLARNYYISFSRQTQLENEGDRRIVDNNGKSCYYIGARAVSVAEDGKLHVAPNKAVEIATWIVEARGEAEKTEEEKEE